MSLKGSTISLAIFLDKTNTTIKDTAILNKNGANNIEIDWLNPSNGIAKRTIV